jgi:hypothetical protein
VEEDVSARLFRASVLSAFVFALTACASPRESGDSFAVQVAEKPAKWEHFSTADHAEIVTRKCKVEIADTASQQVAVSVDGAVSVHTPGQGTLKIWLLRVYKELDEKTGKLQLIRVFTKDSINRPAFSLEAGASYDVDCVDRYTTDDPLSQLLGWYVTVTKRTGKSRPVVVFDSRLQNNRPTASASPERS